MKGRNSKKSSKVEIKMFISTLDRAQWNMAGAEERGVDCMKIVTSKTESKQKRLKR